MKRRLLPLCVLLAGLPAAVSGLGIESILGRDGGMFRDGDADVFLAANSPYRRYFRWVSDDRLEARYPAWADTPRDLTFAGRPVPEAIFRFREDRSLKDVYVSLYNRGDDGPAAPGRFQELLARLDSSLRELTGEKAHRRKASLDLGMRLERRVWIHGGLAYVLRSSVTAGRSRRTAVPEYIQLDIKPFDPEHDPRRESLRRMDRHRIQKLRDLRRNLVVQRNGTVFIDGIPMVDQGSKGYCVVATAERLLRYFGIESVSQHGLAQIAGSSALAGTSIDEMLKAIRKAGPKLGVSLTEKYSYLEDFRAVERIVKDYNRLAAKRRRARRIGLVREGDLLDVTGTLRQMDAALFREMRDRKGWRDRFSRIVRSQVDEGIPVLWTVFLGIAPGDPASPAFGGHLRLIIGYNPRLERIIYSDSWGAGHEKKEMPLGDACAITSGLLVMAPRNY